MAPIYLFTWNLGKDAKARGEAHGLTVQHLALSATKHPFIACLQELPGASEIAQARTPKQAAAAVAALAAQQIAVVPKVVPGLALAYRWISRSYTPRPTRTASS